MKKALILFSGGADSALLVVLAKKLGREIRLVTFSYGQKHSDEINYAYNLAGQLLLGPGPVITTVDLRGAFYNVKSNLLQNGGKADYPGVHDMHVPARNSVFLSVALGLAESFGDDEVWIGCDYSDALNNFPDCRQQYILAMQHVFNLGASREVAICAPLLGLPKEVVKALLVAEGVDLDKVYSGYEPPQSPREILICNRCRDAYPRSEASPHSCRQKALDRMQRNLDAGTPLQGPSGAPGSTSAPIPAPRTYPNDPEAPRRSGSFSPNTTD